MDSAIALDLDACVAAIRASRPDLAGEEPRVLSGGWDSLGILLGDSVFRFPRHAGAETSLRREVALLAAVRPRAALPVPDARLHEGPPLHAQHLLIPGDALITADYERLSGEQRDALAVALAGFHRDLHAIPLDVMEGAGAEPVEAWLSPDETARRALPRLPTGLRDRAQTALDACLDLGTDPLGEVFGMFDAHGWNMAFDHEAGRLNGVFDFGDAGIGPRHREFVYGSFVSPDLSSRTVDHYEWLTTLSLDRQRIALLTRWHRLWELAVCDDRDVPAMVANAERALA